MPRKTQRRSPNQNEIPETIVVGDTSALSLDKIAKGRTWESAAIYELAKKYIEDLGEIG